MPFIDFIGPFIKYILLGIIQGLTEVLPISSSGHIAIGSAILGITTDKGILFSMIVNFGSLIAIFLHFRKLVIRLIGNFVLFVFRPSLRMDPLIKVDFHYCLKIAIGTIPIGITGVLFNDMLDGAYNTPYIMLIVGIGLLVTATLLFIVRDSSYSNGRQDLSYRDAMTIGVGQMFAILPGLSRSGVTTSTGLMRKLSMETALIFSFMLYLPASLGSTVKYFLDWAVHPTTFDWGIGSGDWTMPLYYVAAAIFSFGATLFSLKMIFGFFRKGRLIYFSIYTFILGCLAFGYGILNF